MPNPVTEELEDRAIASLEDNDRTGARSLYKQICQLDPTNAEAWLRLGLIDAETGHVNDAIKYLEIAVSQDPELAEAYLILGKISLKQGRFGDAGDYCNMAVHIDPDCLEGWITLGTVHCREGNPADAERDFMRAVSLSSKPAETWIDIANRLLAQGSLSLAANAYRRALEHKPDNPAVWTTLGNLCRESGDQKNAANAYQLAVSLQPDNRVALRYLAELQLGSGRLVETVHTCQSMLRINPEDAYAYSLMGTALQSQGNLVEAGKCLERSSELESENSTYLFKYACILQTLGDLDKALLYFSKALDTGSGLPAAVGGLVRVYTQKGDDDKVQELLGPLIEAANKDPLVLPTLAFVAPRYGLTDKAIELIEVATSNSLLDDNVRARLHHALGALYESTGNFDAAFASHQRSKELTGTNYNSATHSRYTDRIMTCFSRSFMTAAPHASNDSCLPVFIVGMPRSGTSLVEQILASHRDIYGAGELPDINSIVQSLSGRLPSGNRYPECCGELTGALLDEFAGHYLSELRKHSSTALRIIDKMPHNFRHLGMIELLFPNARVIHISRDPMDTCLSCYFQEFSAAHSYARDLQDLALHYKDYERLMQHWNRVLKIRIMNIKYEALVSGQESVTRELVDFCGLEWDDQCLDFHSSDRIAITLSSSQVREPIYTRSVGRWKNYDKHLEPLKYILERQVKN